jgi:predicted component of type VI protein secretion system
MRNRALLAVAVAVALLAIGAAQAQERAPWLHIRVTEAGADGARVNVNLPVSLVQVFADIAEEEIERELSGRGNHIDIDLARHDLEVADLRRAWAELRTAGDAEFVEIEDDDDYVKISRAGERIVIEFSERTGDDNGRIEVPVSVVDALLAGDGERLNVRAALDEMIATADGEIVLVEDGRTSVRIWIE